MAYHACDKRLTGSGGERLRIRQPVLIFNVLQQGDPATIPGIALA
jgi:hypothetical protein